MELTRIGERIRVLREDLIRHENMTASIKLEIDALEKFAGGDPVSFLDLPIDDLELSVRSTTALRHNHVKSVRELIQFTEIGLLKLPTLGKQSLNEIKTTLQTHGLYLGMKL